MATIDQAELTLLAAMAYGESYYKHDVYEEMAAIASVLVRQRDARGYGNMQAFTKAEPTYSYVVKDGNPRYAQLIGTTETSVLESLAKATAGLTDLRAQNAIAKHEVERDALPNQKAAAKQLLASQERQMRSLENKHAALESWALAYKAARNALERGFDHSNGAFFWDGWDLKTNYENHPKVKRGIKIAKPDHNVHGVEDKAVTVIKYRIVVVTKDGKKSKSKQEVGRYDYIYESTAGHGGTIFWKFNAAYLEVEGAKDYK